MLEARTRHDWSLKPIKHPSLNEQLAEFIGIMLGDGCIYTRRNMKKLNSFAVTITGHSIDDKDYLLNHVVPLCGYLFDIEPSLYYSKSSNALQVRIYRRHLVDYLLTVGLKEGNKIKTQVTIPKWILQNDNYLKACIRGLYDTDGSVYELLPHWPGLFQLSFDNKNITLLNDLRTSLIYLGFNVSKICSPKNGRTPKIYITRKADIQKFLQEIGFSNPKHYRKLQKAFTVPIY